MVTLGFTGTRNGMTEQQRQTVRQLLSDALIMLGPFTGLHGDCLGADADFDLLCKEIGIQTACRPCTFTNMRANTNSTQIAEPKPPMQRNRDIVSDAAVMIACPPNFERIKKGSGTWATIGFSEKAGKQLHVVLPNGDLRRAK
jgi:hypothetical protein